MVAAQGDRSALWSTRRHATHHACPTGAEASRPPAEWTTARAAWAASSCCIECVRLRAREREPTVAAHRCPGDGELLSGLAPSCSLRLASPQPGRCVSTTARLQLPSATHPPVVWTSGVLLSAARKGRHVATGWRCKGALQHKTWSQGRQGQWNGRVLSRPGPLSSVSMTLDDCAHSAFDSLAAYVLPTTDWD